MKGEAEPYIEQKDLENQPNSVTIHQSNYINKQMVESICCIKLSKGHGTGFFCLIPFPNRLNMLPVLITNNHVLKEENISLGNIIKFHINQDKIDRTICIDSSRKVYTSKKDKYDITIIEIKPSDNLNIKKFLEIDDYVYEDLPNNQYDKTDVYLLHYPSNQEVSYSTGGIKCVMNDNYNIIHYCQSTFGSSGGPIINLINFKVIGVHKGASSKSNYNYGTFIKEPIKEFNSKFPNKVDNKIINQKLENENKIVDEDINEITIFYKKNDSLKIDAGNKKKIRKITGEEICREKIFGEKFVNNNRNICKMKINGKEKELCAFYNFGNNQDEIVEIKLIGINRIIDASYMFCGCVSLRHIEDISKWNTKNVNNMTCMFNSCLSLKLLPDISKWNIKNVNSINGIFCNCSELSCLPDISLWDTSNVKDMGSIFSLCSSLNSLQVDISNWNTENVKDMSGMFYGCEKLTSLPDISKWKINKVNDLSYLFNNCTSLKSLPDISIWDTSNVINMKKIFCNCKSLKNLPDISKWNTINVNDMSYMFYNCNSLEEIPEILNWNTNNLKDAEGIFENCSSLKVIPNILQWNINVDVNKKKIFPRNSSKVKRHSNLKIKKCLIF